MYENGTNRPGAAVSAWRLPAFCGLGLCVDAALFHAARLAVSLKRAQTRGFSSVPVRPVAAPQKPWGFELLVTLSRQTRAG